MTEKIQKEELQVKHQYTETDLERAAEEACTDEGNKLKLLKVLTENRRVFSECPGRVKNYVHEIELNDYSLLNSPFYPIPYIYKREVALQIEEMLAWGIIQKEKTEYISPLVCVTKKDKSFRVCLDARALNRKMKEDFLNPPNTNDLLWSFKKGQVLSTIDLTAAYWQISIKKDHTKYLGFIYEGDTYTFIYLPFGLKTSMASLMRFLKGALGDEFQEFTTLYVDDLLVHSDSIDDHFTHLRRILQRLNGFYGQT